jgi:hypothetical protein
LQQSDGGLLGYRAANTYASGAPGTAPAMTSGQASWMLWGNVSGVSGANYAEVNQQPPPGALSYVFDATVNHEDLYNFGALSTTPAFIYAVAVKAYAQKSDAGAKTVSMRMKSGSTDSGGTATGQTPATTYGWLTSVFSTDPNTSAAWTGANLNAATAGFTPGFSTSTSLSANSATRMRRSVGSRKTTRKSWKILACSAPFHTKSGEFMRNPCSSNSDSLSCFSPNDFIRLAGTSGDRYGAGNDRPSVKSFRSR